MTIETAIDYIVGVLAGSVILWAVVEPIVRRVVAWINHDCHFNHRGPIL